MLLFQISEFKVDGSMQSFLHVERRHEARFLHAFRGEDGLCTEFFDADGTDRIGTASDKCQNVEAVPAKKSKPIRKGDWR